MADPQREAALTLCDRIRQSRTHFPRMPGFPHCGASSQDDTSSSRLDERLSSMKGYTKADWHAFRADMIKLHGGRCLTCGRGEPEVVLQVHHKHYVAGRLPWQYSFDECEVLCRGCHGREHGKLRPSFGWTCQGYSDLGDLVGTCDLCGTGLEIHNDAAGRDDGVAASWRRSNVRYGRKTDVHGSHTTGSRESACRHLLAAESRMCGQISFPGPTYLQPLWT